MDNKISFRKTADLHTKMYYVLCSLVFILSVCSYVYLVGKNKLHEAGESRHYVTSTLTLLNKGSISFDRNDIAYAESIFGKFSIKNFQKYNYSDNNAICRFATKEAESDDFVGRSYYWGTYSFLCIPVFWLCRTFHLFQDNMFIAFKITNIIMLLIPLLAVVFLLKGDKTLKFNMLLATAAAPAAQYLGWASAEICIYMFVMLYLIFLHNGQYFRSALCLAFAATLNYCLFPLGIYLLYHFLKHSRNDYLSETTGTFSLKKCFVKKFVLLGCCFLPVVHAAVFTYLQFHSIATMSEMSDANGMFARFVAYLFDLNFGIIVYHHLLFCAFLVFMLFWCLKRNWDSFFLGAAFFFTVMLYSVMAHINCGMEGIARYSAWSSPIMLFPVVKQISETTHRVFSFILCAVYFFINSAILFFPLTSSYFYWSKVADFAFQHCPGIYKPLYSTFISRTLHIDGGYSYEKPVVYYTNNSTVVLCGRNHLAGFWNFYFVPDQDNYDELETQRRKYLASNGDFHYFYTKGIVLPRPKNLKGNTIFFNRENPSFMCVRGFSGIEDWGIWSDGKVAEMYAARPEKAEHLHSMKLTLRPFLPKKGKQEVELRLNDRFVTKAVFTSPENQTVELPMPEDAQNILKFSFAVSDPVSPAEFGASRDVRKLGFGLISLEYQ